VNRKFCRTEPIYVNQQSPHVIEMGTYQYPYKTLEHSSIEVWNWWEDSSATVNVNLLEGSNNTVYFAERPVMFYKRNQVYIKTYRKTDTGPEESTAKATVHVTNKLLFTIPWDTKYCLQGGYDYLQDRHFDQLSRSQE